MLLEKAKTFSNSKHGSTSIAVNKPSCSETNTAVQFNDNLTTSDIENCDQDETNMSNLGEFIL